MVSPHVLLPPRSPFVTRRHAAMPPRPGLYAIAFVYFIYAMIALRYYFAIAYFLPFRHILPRYAYFASFSRQDACCPALMPILFAMLRRDVSVSSYAFTFAFTRQCYAVRACVCRMVRLFQIYVFAVTFDMSFQDCFLIIALPAIVYCHHAASISSPFFCSHIIFSPTLPPLTPAAHACSSLVATIGRHCITRLRLPAHY